MTDSSPPYGAAHPSRSPPPGKGTMQPGNLLRCGFPRTDLQVTADGVQLKPGLHIAAHGDPLGAGGQQDATA